MSRRPGPADLAIGAAAGYLAGRVMSWATTRFYEAQSEESKAQEQEVSYGVTFTVAARKLGRLLGAELHDDEAVRLGTLMHHGLGMAWAPVYMWLRLAKGMAPIPAAVASGVSMFVLVDEAATVALGLAPPPQAYPPETHLRGLVGHLVFGAALAAFVEGGWRLAGRDGRSR